MNTAGRPGGWKKMLDAVPVRNEAVEAAVHEDGSIRVKVRKKKPVWLVPPLSWIMKPRLYKTLALDRLGGEIRELCDGERTVEQVAGIFAERYRLSFHEARVSVTEYLGSLVKFGVIAIKVSQSETQSGFRQG